MEVLYKHFVQGIAQEGPAHFGGETCFKEIPAYYHYSVSILVTLFMFYLLYRWSNSLVDQNAKIQKKNINVFERVMLCLGSACFIYTAYYKIITKRGLFLLNPCHIALLMLLFLLKARDNSTLFMRRFHSLWTGWWIGGLAGFLFPHLEDISNFQISLFFTEHALIWPLGPLITYRRYGFIKPTLKIGLITFGTFIMYQLAILVPVCRSLKVNINFALCHSPQQPFFQRFGHHYFTIQMFQLTLITIFLQYFTYGYVKILEKTWHFFRNQIGIILKYIKNGN